MKSLVGLFSLVTVLAFSGCGGGKKETADATPPSADPPGVKIFRLTGDDTMHFNLTELAAAPGESLRVVLTNIGRMPKQQMAHNWVLLQPRPDAEVAKFAMEAAARAPAYLPADQSAIIVHTRLLGPGEHDQIDFDAPTQPGEYPFLCSFPGHFTLMRGKLIVK